MAVYHQHVLWCYAYEITVYDKDDKGEQRRQILNNIIFFQCTSFQKYFPSDFMCLFKVKSIGPSFSKKHNIIKGGKLQFLIKIRALFYT
uniref:Uncharacterized protein n=1 Tax=Heterorhabditis bacteriophora TaxID=37862 RepID=A0A1I7W6Y1_HETBA